MIAVIKDGPRKYEIVRVVPDPDNPGWFLEEGKKKIDAWRLEELNFLPYLPGFGDNVEP